MLLPVIKNIIIPIAVPTTYTGDAIKLGFEEFEAVRAAWSNEENPTFRTLEGTEIALTPEQKATLVKSFNTLEINKAARKVADKFSKSQEDGTALLAPEVGFINLHTSDVEDNRGDKKWYALGTGKIKHQFDPMMSKSAAIASGFEVG